MDFYYKKRDPTILIQRTDSNAIPNEGDTSVDDEKHSLLGKRE